MKYQIKQLGLGGVLDQGINLLKDHFGLLFGIVAVSLVPLNLVNGYLQFVMQQQQVANPNELGFALVVLMFSSLLGLFLLPLVYGAMIHAIAALYLSRTTSIGESYRHGMKRYLPILGTWLLFTLAMMGGLMLCVIPGILVGLWFSLAIQIATLEYKAGSGALTRSKELMKGNMGTGFVLGVVVGAMNLGLVLGVQMIPLPYVQIIGTALVSSLCYLLGMCISVVFYFSCRCKVENFDLQILAESVGNTVEGVEVIEEL